MGAYDTMLKTCTGQVISLYPPSFSGNWTAVTNFCALLTSVVISHHKTIGVLDFEDITPLNVGWWVNGVVCTAIDCVTICLNSVSIWVFTRRSTRSPTHLLLAIVSGLDLLTCVFQLPLQVHVYLRGGYKHLPSRSWCDVYNYLYNFVPATLHSTAFLLNMCLSVQRCVGIKNVQQWRLKSVCSYKGTFISIAICATASAVVHALYPINIGVEGVETIGKEMLESGKLRYVQSCKVSPRHSHAYDGLLSAYIWARVVLLQTLPAVVLGVCNIILIITSYKVYSYRRKLIGKLGGIASLRNACVPSVEVFKHFGNRGESINDSIGNGEHEKKSNGVKRVHLGRCSYRRSISHEIQRNRNELCVTNIKISFINRDEETNCASCESVGVPNARTRPAVDAAICMDNCLPQKNLACIVKTSCSQRDVAQCAETPGVKSISSSQFSTNSDACEVTIQGTGRDSHVEDNALKTLHSGSNEISMRETVLNLEVSTLENINTDWRYSYVSDKKEFRREWFSTWPISRKINNSELIETYAISKQENSNSPSCQSPTTAEIQYNQNHSSGTTRRTYSQPNATCFSKEIPRDIQTESEIQRTSASQHSNGELRSTLMLVLVTTLTLLAEVFVVIMLIFQFVDSVALKQKGFISTSTLSVMFALSNLVTLLTFPLNFFIFCGLSRSFRDALQEGIGSVIGVIKNIRKGS